jgi:dinuclear metal center YbgI/SA1388 family protein
MQRVKKSARVIDIYVTMAQIAPLWTAAEWDNVGLLVGSANWPARRVLLTIDMTAAVLKEAIADRFNCVISYHPPIFKATKYMVPGLAAQEQIAAEALSHRIAVYSPHTALDAVPDGTNGAIAAMCDLTDVRPFRVLDQPHTLHRCKVVVFVPSAAIDDVAEALFDAGAGHIGQYEKCSFRSPGQGSFLGGESTKPRIGRRGRLEKVEEIRLEAICYANDLPKVVEAIRESHPYEEPAFDVYDLRIVPSQDFGPGRLGQFADPISLVALAKKLVRRTASQNPTIIGNPRAKLQRGLVCVGSAGDLPFDAPGFRSKGDVVITGEIRHHDALKYDRLGCAAIALGHWASERPVLKPLAARLRKELPGVEFIVSRADRDPFRPI